MNKSVVTVSNNVDTFSFTITSYLTALFNCSLYIVLAKVFENLLISSISEDEATFGGLHQLRAEIRTRDMII
ncbi:hypothetical protein ACFX2I_042899 [Malus domestica]